VMVFLQDHEVDFAFVSETWMTQQANHTSATIKYYGYNIIHDYRQMSMGGGTAVIFKAGHTVNTVNLDIDNISTFEYTSAAVKCSVDMRILLVCLYRTGPVTQLFIDDINSLMQVITLRYDYIIVGGDFNIHIENAADKCKLWNFLKQCNHLGLNNI